MFYKIFTPENFIEDKNEERELVSILKNDDALFQIATLKKNYEFDIHVSDSNVCIYLIDGEIDLNFIRSEDCSCSECFCRLPDEKEEDKKTFRIKKGQMFMFEKHKPHSVKALKDSLFFIVKI